MELIVGPMLAALAMFGFVVVSDPQTIHIERISVPAALVADGYAPTVLENRLFEALRKQETEAYSFYDARRLAADSEPTTLRLLSENIGMTPSLRAMQKAFGKIGYTVSGDMVRQGDTLTLSFRSLSADGRNESIAVSGKADDVDALVNSGAEALLERIDPYAHAVRKFKKEWRPIGEVSFPHTRYVLGKAQDAVPLRIDPRWATNLLGVIAQVEQSSDKAIEIFDRALALDPDFSPSLLNRGVSLASKGQHREAIESYRRVLELPNGGAYGPIHAAAYSWWGVSLAALGQNAAADQSFEYAIQSEPTYADAYAKWSSVLAAQNRNGADRGVIDRRFGNAIPLPLFPEYFAGALGPRAYDMLPKKPPTTDPQP